MFTEPGDRGGRKRILTPSIGNVTDNGVPRWDGTDGTALQDSLVSISDTGDVIIKSTTYAGHDIRVYQSDGFAAPYINFGACRGPIGSPGGTLSGDGLAYFFARAIQSSGADNAGGAGFIVYATEDKTTDNNLGGSIGLYTTPNGTTGALQRVFANHNGNVAIGEQSPDRRLHVEQDSAATNTVTYVERLTSTSSGTPANGIGVGIEFEVETAAGNNEIGATIEAATSDVTPASEDFDLVFNVMRAGFIEERLRLTGDPANGGALLQCNAPNTTAYRVSNTHTSGSAGFYLTSATQAAISFNCVHTNSATYFNADAGSLEIGTTSGYIRLYVNGGNNDKNIYLNTTGYVGMGTVSQARKLSVVEDDATNNAITYLQRWTHTTSGTPGIGIGIGVEFEVETSAGNNEVGATIEAVTTDVTSTSEDFDLVIKTMTAGAAATEKFRIGSTVIQCGEAFAHKVVALTDGATPALDASLGNSFRLIAAGDRTIGIPSNPTDGQRIIIRHNASGGARTLALNTGTGGFRFGTDITALTQTVSGKTDYIGAIYNATDNKWDVVAYAKGF